MVKKFEHFQPVFLIHSQLCNVVGNSNDGKDGDRGDTKGLLGIASHPPSSFFSYLCSVLHCCARMLEFARHPHLLSPQMIIMSRLMINGSDDVPLDEDLIC